MTKKTKTKTPRTRSQGQLMFKKKVDPFMDFALENLIQHLNQKK